MKFQAKATVNPVSSQVQDFSKEKEVLYTVKAEDGTKQDYKVTVKIIKAQKDPASLVGIQPVQPIINLAQPVVNPVLPPVASVPSPSTIEQEFTLEPYTGADRVEVGADFIIKGDHFKTSPGEVENV